VARKACAKKCPPQGVQAVDVACLQKPHAGCLSCCDGNHPAGVAAIDCVCQSDVCADVCTDTVCAQKSFAGFDSPCGKCVEAALAAPGTCAFTGQTCYNQMGKDCSPLMTCWNHCP
jgi:hypothetical protein